MAAKSLKDLWSFTHQVVEKVKKYDGVYAIGLTGSLASGDIWLGSDIDLIVIKDRNVSLPAAEIMGDVPLQFHPINREELLKRPMQYEHMLLLLNSKILHDPTGVLKEAESYVERTFFSEKEIERRIENYIERANSLYRDASNALSLKDYQSSIIECRYAMYWLGYVLCERSQRPITSTRRTISKILNLFSENEDFCDDLKIIMGFQNVTAAKVKKTQNVFYRALSNFYDFASRDDIIEIMPEWWKSSYKHVSKNAYLELGHKFHDPLLRVGYYFDALFMARLRLHTSAGYIISIDEKLHKTTKQDTLLRKLLQARITPKDFSQLYVKVENVECVDGQFAREVLDKTQKWLSCLRLS